MILSAYKYKYSRGSLAVNLDGNGYFPAGYTVYIDGEKRDFPGTLAGHDDAQKYYYQQQQRAEMLERLIDTENERGPADLSDDCAGCERLELCRAGRAPGCVWSE